MDHVASVPSATSGRMSPEAVGLSVLAHALMALTLWAWAAYRPAFEPPEDPVQITLEQPKPPEPKPPEPKPPPEQAQKPPPQAMTPPVESIPAPAEEADKRQQKRASGDARKDIAAPPPDSVEKEVPAPSPPPPQIEAAKPEPKPAPPPPEPKPEPQPPPEMAAARPEALPPPPPPPAPRPQPQPAPQPAPPKPSPPAVTTVQPQQPPKPPPALSPRPQPQPSPLTSRQHQQPPAVARREDAPSSSAFVNPADERNRVKAQDNYLWEVVRKLRGYRYHANVPMGMEGLTVVQIVIARDGRLLSAQIVRSSGVPAMDQGVLNGVRQGSPYTPLPASIAGPSATFRLPLVSVPDIR